MKKLKPAAGLAALLAALTVEPGCALLLVGGVAAGATYGTIKQDESAIRRLKPISRRDGDDRVPERFSV